MRSYNFLAQVVFLFLLLTGAALGQTPSPTPNPLPAPKSTPLEGKSELTDVKIEPRILTYNALDEVGRDVAKEVAAGTTSRTIFFLDPRQVASLDTYRMIRPDIDRQIVNFEKRYDEIRKSYCEAFDCTGPSALPLRLNGVLMRSFPDTFGRRSSNPALSLKIREAQLLLQQIDASGSEMVRGFRAGNGQSFSLTKSNSDQLEDRVTRLSNLASAIASEIKNPNDDDVRVLQESIEKIRRFSQIAKSNTLSLSGFRKSQRNTSPLNYQSQWMQVFDPPTASAAPTTAAKVALGGLAAKSLAIAGGVAGVLNPITASMGFAADLLALLRTDTKIVGVDVSPDKEAFVSALSQSLRCKGFTVYHPTKYFPATDGSSLHSGIMARFRDLDDKKIKIEKELFPYRFWITAGIDQLNKRKERIQKRIDIIDKFIVDLEGQRAKEPNLEIKKKWQAEIDNNLALRTQQEDALQPFDTDIFSLNIAKSHIDGLTALGTDVRTFVTNMVTAPANEESKFVTYLRAERLEGLIGPTQNYNILDADITGGGNDRTQKNLIRYFTGAKIDFSGGAIVSWKLFSPSGTLRSSAVNRHYTGYVASKKLIGSNPAPECR